MDDLNNFPGIAEHVQRTELVAFFERAVFADWRRSNLIPPSEDAISYIRDNTRIFLNLDRLKNPRMRMRFVEH